MAPVTWQTGWKETSKPQGSLTIDRSRRRPLTALQTQDITAGAMQVTTSNRWQGILGHSPTCMRGRWQL